MALGAATPASGEGSMRNVDSAVTQHVMRPERLIHRPVSPDSPDGVTLSGLPAVGVLADATAESPQPIGIRRQSPRSGNLALWG